MKDILTTKLTKATKGSDIFDHNFVLFVCFVVKFAVSFWLRLCRAGALLARFPGLT
jgi:hypothetical protein